MKIMWALALTALSGFVLAQDLPVAPAPGSAVPPGYAPSAAGELWVTEPLPTEVRAFDRRTIAPTPGWIVDAGVALIFADLRGRASGSSGFGTGDDFNFDVNAGGFVGLGYVLADNRWTLLMNYRFFGTSGRPVMPDASPADPLFAAEIDVRSRLDVNEFNWLIERQILLATDALRVGAYGGARLGSVFYDVTMNTSLVIPAFDDSIPMEIYSIEAQGSQRFLGAGPVVGLSGDWSWRPGLSLFSKTDFAALIGETTTRMSFRTNAPMLSVLPDSTEKENRTAKTLRTVAGVNFAPTLMPHMSFQLGYQFEYWWDLARVEDVNQDLLMQGVFGQMRVAY